MIIIIMIIIVIIIVIIIIILIMRNIIMRMPELFPSLRTRSQAGEIRVRDSISDHP